MKSKKARPVIGVTGPDRGGKLAWLFCALAVLRAGGWPRRLTAAKPLRVDDLDGVILSGGVDLDPSLYGGDPSDVLEEVGKNAKRRRRPLLTWILLPLIYVLRRVFSLHSAVSMDRERDKFEVSIVRAALDQQKPVLGICRGSQMLNAALGGSLHREIRGFYTEMPYIKSVLQRKRITLTPGTRLASVLGNTTCWVNSLHHQANNQIAPALRIAAREDCQLIQAVEHPALPFVVGVQWHPEFLPHVPAQQRLFRKLVASSRQSSSQRTSGQRNTEQSSAR